MRMRPERIRLSCGLDHNALDLAALPLVVLVLGEPTWVALVGSGSRPYGVIPLVAVEAKVATSIAGPEVAAAAHEDAALAMRASRGCRLCSPMARGALRHQEACVAFLVVLLAQSWEGSAPVICILCLDRLI